MALLVPPTLDKTGWAIVGKVLNIVKLLSEMLMQYSQLVSCRLKFE
jgi:hypothetical protein